MFLRPPTRIRDLPWPWWLLLAATLCVDLAIAAGASWIFPDSGRLPTYMPFGDSTLFWQFNLDSFPHLKTAAFFQDYLNVNPVRIERPLSFLVVNLVAELLYAPVALLRPDATTLLVCVLIAYGLFKIATYVAGMLACVHVFSHFMRLPVAALSTLVVFFNGYMVWTFTEFHTNDLQVITPILIAVLALHYVKKVSVGRGDLMGLALYSILAGLLMLMKHNYAAYVAVLAAAALFGWWGRAAFSFVLHSVPIGLYIVYLKLVDLPLYMQGFQVSNYKFGSYAIDLLGMTPADALYTLFDKLVLFLPLALQFSAPWSYLGIAGLVVLIEKRCYAAASFALTLLLALFAQMFVSGMFLGRISADFLFVAVGLSGVAVDRLLAAGNFRWTSQVAASAAGVWFLLTIARLEPWSLQDPRTRTHDAAAFDYKTQIGLSFVYWE